MHDNNYSPRPSAPLQEQGLRSDRMETPASRSVSSLPATAKTHSNDRKPTNKTINLESIPDHPVTNLDFDVTENCNLGCVYCFKGEMYNEAMSLPTMKRTLEWLLLASHEAQSVNCNFMGGEPTLRFKQLREFAPWAVQRAASVGKRVTFSMTTNLTLFTEEIRSFVDQYGFGILMSIDGCPEVQDAQRPAKNGKPMSQIVEYWARSLLKTRPRSQARATIHPKYVHRLAESVRYFEEIGFKDVVLANSNYADWTPADFECADQQFELIVQFITGRAVDGSDFGLSAYSFYANRLIHPRHNGRETEIEYISQPCGAGKGYLMVDYTGDIWPCHRFDGADTASGANGQFRLGNIFQAGFNEDLQRAFLDFDHLKVHKPSCNSCPVNPVCGGFCPAANLSETGSIYTPHDAFCRWSQMLYYWGQELYRRLESRSPEALNRLVEIGGRLSSTGEK